GQELLTHKVEDTIRGLRVAFSPNGERLASGGTDDGTLKVWDAHTAQDLLTLKGHKARISDVVFRSDGRRLATASEDKTVKVWDAQIGVEPLTLKGDGEVNIASMAFTPDGKHLATALTAFWRNTNVKLWDAQTGKELVTFKGHARPVYCVAISP